MTDTATGHSTATKSESEIRRIVSLFERHINRGQVRYLRAGHLDVVETERLGVGFTDSVTGRRLIDCFSSAGSFNVSRHHPRIVRALEEAAGEVDMGTPGALSEWKVALARRLTELAPGDLNRVLFASGGGEAVDAAIKLARGATGRGEIVSTVKAYHGHTGFALSANGKAHYRSYCEPLMPQFRFVPFNDLDAMEGVISNDTAAVIIEPVQGEAGIFVGSPDYLAGLRRLCDNHGALLIFDEIQTGFGRTGRMFACEHSGVVPDIMTVAKSLGGSLFANGAVLYRDVDLLTSYVDSNPRFHRTLGGGSDIGARVSLEVLNVLEDEELPQNAERMGKQLMEALLELKSSRPRIIKEVRGVGLMLGIEYIHEFMGPMMSDALAKQGVFAAYSGNAPQVMRFMVPITISQPEMDALVVAIQRAARDMDLLLPVALLAAKVPAIKDLLNNEGVQTRLFGGLRSAENVFTKLLNRFAGENR